MKQAKKTIVFICPNYPKPGGVEVVTGMLADYFVANGFDVSIFVCGTVSKHPLVIEMPGKLNSKENLNFIDAYLQSRKVDFVFNQGVFSLIYLHTKKYPNTVFINTLHGKPFWELDAFKYLTIKEHLANSRNFLSKIGSALRYVAGSVKAEWASPRIKTFYRKQIENVDHYVVLDSSFKKILEQKLFKAKPNPKIKVLYNPLPVLVSQIAPKEKVVLFVGRLIRSSKRVDRLLRIWSRIEKNASDWKLCILGDGEDRYNLEQMSLELGLKNIEFLGFKDAGPYYKSASILCMTSSWEGTPLVIPEAQSNGTVPIVFGCVPSMYNLIDTSVNGIIIEPFDEDEFAKQLLSLMLDPERLNTLSANCPAKTLERTMNRIGEQWLKVLGEA